MYKAERGEAPLRVFHLRYDDSAETDQFAEGLARERRALEGLIGDKAHMVLPEMQDPSQVSPPPAPRCTRIPCPIRIITVAE